MVQQTLSTQQFVEVKEIEGGVVHLKKGGMRKVLMVSGINFELKSSEEQDGILGAFQNFLNTIDFSVQFFIHSRKVNVAQYLERITRRKDEEKNELLKVQIDDYVDFIKSFVADNPIVNKTFFVVVPYNPILVKGKAKGLLDVFSFNRSNKTSSAQNERMEKQKGTLQLEQRVDEVVAGLEAIGLHTQPMEDEELTELFYNLYNPALVEKEDLVIAKDKD